MKPGDVVLVRFPQADLQTGKLRPALIVAVTPGKHGDLLLSLISSQTQQAIPDFDVLIAPADADYVTSGLKVPSVVRLSRLAVVESAVINGRLGYISAKRLQEMKQRLVDWLKNK